MSSTENRDRYLRIANEVGELLAEKNQAYGDSFVRGCEVLRVLYPNGVPVDAYPDMLAMIRVIDKLFRIATDRDALGENPWRDVAGYAILSTDFHANRKHEYTGITTKPDWIATTLANLRVTDKEKQKVVDTREFFEGKLPCAPVPVFGVDPWPAYASDTAPASTDPDKPRICPACSHDHARATGDRGTCLYARSLDPTGAPVYCGCLGPGTGPAPDVPVVPDVNVPGVTVIDPKHRPIQLQLSPDAAQFVRDAIVQRTPEA